MPSNVRKHQQARVMALTPLEVSAGMARLAGRYRVVVDEDHVTVFPARQPKVAGSDYDPEQQSSDAREYLLTLARTLEPPGAIAVMEISETMIQAMLMRPNRDGSWRKEYQMVNWMEAYWAEADALARLALLLDALKGVDDAE